MEFSAIDGGKIIKAMTELMRVACMKDVRELKHLAKEFEKIIDNTDAEGWTALHYAAANGFEENVTTLLAHGASPHTQNLKKETPYDIAVMNGKVEVAKMLKEAEARTPRIKPEDVPERIISAEEQIAKLQDEVAFLRSALAKVLEQQGLSVSVQQPQSKSEKPRNPPHFRPGGQ